MEVLIVVATLPEIAPLLDHLSTHWIESPTGTYTHGNCTVRTLITGIGMHRTAYALGKEFSKHHPDLCINAGIAGAFPGKAEIGEVLHVTSEILSDIGAESEDGVLVAPEAMGLLEDISSVDGLVNQNAAEYAFLRTARGVTVNTVHGTTASISTIINRYDPDVETMEGGAFFYCCLKENIPFIEVRAISNIIEPRNKERWDIPLAIQRLNEQLIEIVSFFVE